MGNAIKEITLINLTENFYAFGLRRISGYVKNHIGVDVKMLFCTDFKNYHLSGRGLKDKILSPSLIDDILKLVEGSRIIGLSLMTPGEPTAVQITRAIKAAYPDKSVIWGGVHPTISPERCLDHADYVCVGEGERALSGFIDAVNKGSDAGQARGIWSKSENSVIKNPPMPLAETLDELGFPDFGGTGQYVTFKGRVVPVNPAMERRLIGNVFWVLMSQGCPYKCAYCLNSSLINTQKEYARIRSYSIPAFMDYMAGIKRKYDVMSVQFLDDAFFNLPRDTMNEFCGQWGKKVGLKFHIMGVPPAAFTEEKIDMLIGAGLKSVRVGIQSGSEGFRSRVYKRRYKDQTLIDISEHLAKRRDRMSICSYDFILDCQWESDEDRLRGLGLLSRMRGPYSLNLFSLTLYEGTDLYNMAKAEGTLDAEKQKSTIHDFLFDNNYVNLLYSLYAIVRIPGGILRALIGKDPRRLRRRVPKSLISMVLYLKYLRLVMDRFIKKDPTYVPFARAFRKLGWF